MDRWALVRPLMFGALVTGLVPLTGAGVGGAAADESPAVVCASIFGERGPADGPVVGEGPSGDPMPVTIAWNPADWPDGLRDVVTCLSVDGRAVPSLATAQGGPPNSGTFNFNLTLPSGEPAAVVCQQSVLVGAGSAGDRRHPTEAMCFKLRSAAPPRPEEAGGYTSGDPPVGPPGTPPARTYAPRTPPARGASGAPPEAARPAGPPAVTPPAMPPPAVTPPSGAPPARALAGTPPAGPAQAAAPPAPDDRPGANAAANRRVPMTRTPAHLLPGAWSSPSARGAVDPISRPSRGSGATAGSTSPDREPTPPARAALGAGLNPAPATSTPTAEATKGVSGPVSGEPAGAEAPRAALARTGVTDRIPLAAGGSLLAFGGAAIVLAEPRRRARPAGAR